MKFTQRTAIEHPVQKIRLDHIPLETWQYFNNVAALMLKQLRIIDY